MHSRLVFLTWRLAVVSALLLPVAVRPAHAAPLSAAERRAVAAVDAAVPGAQALLRRLVNRNSGTLDLEGVRAVGALIAPSFDSLGVRTRWVDGTPFGRAGHLVARRAGAHPRLAVLLIGHLDTVFEADSPFQSYVALSESTATGPGIADMKGGDVIMLLALRALAAAGALDRLDVRVVLDGDEELPGSPLALARHELLEAAHGCDLAICFENGSGDPRQALVGRRGFSSWRLAVSGHRAHSGQIFRPAVGFGAVYEAARILDDFRDSLAAEPHLTFSPGLLLGGSELASEPGSGRGTASGKTNVVAETTLVEGDLRTLSPPQLVHAREVMSRIVARHLPGTDATIAFSDGYPPLAPAAAHDSLLAAFDRASRDLGYGAVTATNPDDAGAGDIAFVGEIVPMALDGVGLAGGGGHTVHEWGDVRALAENAKRVAVTLMRLADRAEPRPGGARAH